MAATASVAALGEVAASEVAPGVAALLVVDLVAVLVARTLPLVVAVMISLPLRRPSLGCLGKITRSSPLCRTPPSSATGRQMVVTTRIQRRSARRSTSAPMMAPADEPSTRSCVPTAPSSTSSTSSAAGGSTWTAPLRKTSTS